MVLECVEMCVQYSREYKIQILASNVCTVMSTGIKFAIAGLMIWPKKMVSLSVINWVGCVWYSSISQNDNHYWMTLMLATFYDAMPFRPTINTMPKWESLIILRAVVEINLLP